MGRSWIVIIIISTFNFFQVKGQNFSPQIENLISQFYETISTRNFDKAHNLIKNIDSLLLGDNSLNNKELANYYNSKGYLYFLDKKDPSLFLIKADSLNNNSLNYDLNIKVYSNVLLADYYFENQDNEKAEQAYSTIIDIPNLPQKYYKNKSKALDKIFFIQRLQLNNDSRIDSIAVKKTAHLLLNFKKKLKDTLNIQFGEALSFLNKKVESEKLFIAITKIPQTDQNFNKYSKFQSLFWLNTFYDKNIGNYNGIDIKYSLKLIPVAEELLATVKNTDFVDMNRIYQIYCDICVAAIITNNKQKLKQYETKIINLLNSSSYLNNNNLKLEKFYYVLHKLTMYYEIDHNYEKAKYYSFKNVELIKHLYGEVSVQHEKELLSLENIIKLKMFDYEEAYKISLLREKIIKKLYSENSLEYLDLLYQQHHIFLSQMNFERCLELSENAMIISEGINCNDQKLCDDVLYIYLNALNSNNQSKLAIEKTQNLNYTSNFSKLFSISKIRRNAYRNLESFHNVNLEFEWVLDQINDHIKKIIADSDAAEAYFQFSCDYQEHLRTSGRLNKALVYSENNLDRMDREGSLLIANLFRLNYLNILIQMGKCNQALKYVENVQILKFNDITTPNTKLWFENHLNIKFGRIYNCLGNKKKAIEVYERIVDLESHDNDYEFVYLELSNLYMAIDNNENAKKYLSLFEKNLITTEKFDINQLYLLIDAYRANGEFDKVIDYLLPLSDMIIDEICAKSFYSSNDNYIDKLTHDDILNLLLTLNQDENYSHKLARNALWFSNLYKSKLDFYGQVNLNIQNLKRNNDSDAVKLEELENLYNKNPTVLLREEINQLKTKIITYRFNHYKQLCELQFNDVFEQLESNELVIDLISYQNKKYGTNDYAINFSYANNNIKTISLDLGQLTKLKDKDNIKSYFFDFIHNFISKSNIFCNNCLDTFYIIPSGKANLISFSALSLSLEEKLGRSIKIHVINSIADIQKIKNQHQKSIDNLLLLGDIDFDSTERNELIKNNSIRGLQLKRSIDDSGIPLWGYLPGTKEEIENIESLANSNNIKTSILSNKAATEKNLANLINDSKDNTVLHIATHGYFFPDSSIKESENLFTYHQNPLLRSGLILSGANSNWNNTIIVDPNSDGILTAEEISFMDLSNVELVVLSACDTGLGEVSNLEGINGLQRAFKLAGANKLITSLWKVPDKETAEFFEHFYSFLLKKKLTINESFRESQKIMNQKYDPYYWASFVLLE